MKTLKNGLKEENTLLTLNTIFLSTIIFFNFKPDNLSYENILFTLLCLNLYFTIRLIFRWFNSNGFFKYISFSIGVVVTAYTLYLLNSSEFSIDISKLYLVLLLIVGEFTASTLSLNIKNIIYKRSEEDSLNKHLPIIPFELKKNLKFIPISLLLLLLTALISHFIIGEPIKSFYYIVLLLPFFIHILSLVPYFLLLDSEFIESKKSLFNEQDTKQTLTNIGKKLANKDSKSCRKTNTEQYQTIVYYLNNGLNIDEIYENRYTFLLPATCCGDEKLVKLLIENGADVNFKSSAGMTALKLASLHGSFNLVKLLIENGADVNVRDLENKTALDYAQEKNFKDIVEILANNK